MYFHRIGRIKASCSVGDDTALSFSIMFESYKDRFLMKHRVNSEVFKTFSICRKLIEGIAKNPS